MVRKLGAGANAVGPAVRNGPAYTLIDTQTRDDGLFELEGHLEAPYEIYTRENRAAAPPGPGDAVARAAGRGPVAADDATVAADFPEAGQRLSSPVGV